MLSLSADKTESDIDLQMINGVTDAADNSHLTWAGELMAFAGALASRDETALNDARETLRAAAGAEVLVDAACVAANFQRMVRIADSTRIPVDAERQPMMNIAAEELQLRRFASAENTPELGPIKKLLGPLQRKIGPLIMNMKARRSAQ